MCKKFLGSKKESHRIRSDEKAAAKDYQSQTSLLSLSLSLLEREWKQEEKLRETEREKEFSVLPFFVCVCVRVLLSSLLALRAMCVLYHVRRRRKCAWCVKIMKKVRQKNWKKAKKAGKRRDARRRKKHNKALFSLIPFCALRSLYYASSFILVVEKSYTHKRDGERENDAMWEKKDDTLNDSIVLRVLFIYARGPSST